MGVVLELGILGPLEVRLGGEPVAPGGRRQRALLAILALPANEVVSSDRLIDGLIEAELALGRQANVISSLEVLVREQPFRALYATLYLVATAMGLPFCPSPRFR